MAEPAKVEIAQVIICPHGGPTQVLLSDGKQLVGLRDVRASAGVDQPSTVFLTAYVQ